MKTVKLFEQWLNEGQFVLKSLETQFGIRLDLYDNGRYLALDLIQIPKADRGQGTGTQVMELICQYADLLQRPIYLTPSKDFGATSTARLEKFYKSHGFTKNKDHSESRATMVRLPK